MVGSTYSASYRTWMRPLFFSSHEAVPNHGRKHFHFASHSKSFPLLNSTIVALARVPWLVPATSVAARIGSRQTSSAAWFPAHLLVMFYLIAGSMTFSQFDSHPCVRFWMKKQQSKQFSNNLSWKKKFTLSLAKIQCAVKLNLLGASNLIGQLLRVHLSIFRQLDQSTSQSDMWNNYAKNRLYSIQLYFKNYHNHLFRFGRSFDWKKVFDPVG